MDFDLVDHLSPSLTFANTIQDVIVAVLAAVHTAVSKGGSYVCSPTPWQPGQTRKGALSCVWRVPFAFITLYLRLAYATQLRFGPAHLMETTDCQS